ncbi:GNAT superfamily N-acetyltransferase [Paraburkholderia sp. GAS38]|jgi:GNAT superfamily N-acetyltransferase
MDNSLQDACAALRRIKALPLQIILGFHMEQIVFRSALLADIPAIVAMLADDELGSQREITGLPLDERYVAAFRAIEADANQQLVVVVDGAEVIGTLQLSFIPGIARMGAWRGQIEAVRIAAHRRDSGLGQKMFEWAIATCRSRGCNLVQLTTDRSRADAHRFYEKLGFVASHVGYKLAL